MSTCLISYLKVWVWTPLLRWNKVSDWPHKIRAKTKKWTNDNKGYKSLWGLIGAHFNEEANMATSIGHRINSTNIGRKTVNLPSPKSSTSSNSEKDIGGMCWCTDEILKSGITDDLSKSPEFTLNGSCSKRQHFIL